MNARLSRDERDAKQLDELARWRVDHESEARESVWFAFAIVVATLLMFTVSIALIAVIVVAWAATEDDRFGWALALIGVGEVVAWSYLFRKHPDGVGR